MTASLARHVILNTRPAHQQAALKAMLEADGASVLSFPVIEIVPVETTSFHQSLAQNLREYDILLFVSRNAVDGAFKFFTADDLPESVQLGVIGSATRKALGEVVGDRGTPLVANEPFNSEALLEAPGLQQVENKRVLIFRGQVGRNLLGDELAGRGANVEYCEVYRRELPQVGKHEFSDLVAKAFASIVVLTSNEGMHNLMRLVDDEAAERLRAIPWLLISERMRESARKLGHNGDVIIADNASDTGIYQSIHTWANS